MTIVSRVSILRRPREMKLNEPLQSSQTAEHRDSNKPKVRIKRNDSNIRNRHLTAVEQSDIKFVIDDKRYISEIIGDDWQEKWNSQTPVFICSQTGSGKTRLLLKTILSKALIYNKIERQKNSRERVNIIYFSNRVGLDLQVKKDICIECDSRLFNDYSKIIWENRTLEGRKAIKKLGAFDNENVENPEDYTIAVMKYQDVLDYTSNATVKDILDNLNKFDIAIFDEAHFFTSDSTFNKHIPSIHNKLIQGLNRARRVYLSATMDSSLEVLIREEVENQKAVQLLNHESKEFRIPSEEEYFYRSVNMICQNSSYRGYLPRPLVSLDTIFANNDIRNSVESRAKDSFGKYLFWQNRDNTENYFGEKVDDVLEDLQKLRPIYYGNLKSYAYIEPIMIDLDFTKKDSDPEIEDDDADDSSSKNSKNARLVKDIVAYVNDEIKVDKDNKMVIFVESKEFGRDLRTALGKDRAIFINADNKEEDERAIKAFNEIVQKAKFEEDILISTAVLDNGINIDDDKVKNMMILAFDRVQYIQMLGRVRNSSNLKLYIPRRPEKLMGSKVSKTRRTLYDLLYKLIEKNEEVGEKTTKFIIPNLIRTIDALTRLYRGMNEEIEIKGLKRDTQAYETLIEYGDKLARRYQLEDNAYRDRIEDFFYNLKQGNYNEDSKALFADHMSLLDHRNNPTQEKFYLIEILLIILGLREYKERAIRPLSEPIEKYFVDKTLNGIYEMFNEDYEFRYDGSNVLGDDLLDGYTYIQLARIKYLITQLEESNYNNQSLIDDINKEIQLFNHTYGTAHDDYFIKEILGWLGRTDDVNDLKYIQLKEIKEKQISKDQLEEELKELLNSLVVEESIKEDDYLKQYGIGSNKDMVNNGETVKKIQALVKKKQQQAINKAIKKWKIEITSRRFRKSGEARTYWVIHEIGKCPNIGEKIS